MNQEITVSEDLSQAISLFDAAGDCDESVNKELLERHNLEYSYHKNGDFCPLTKRELSLLHYGKGFKLAGGSYARFIRMFLLNGEKVINISDDDYMTSKCDSERVESFYSNATASTKIYKEIADAFGIEFHWTCDVNSEQGCTEYFADIYIPVKIFDFLKDDVEFANYFLERKYLTCIHAKKFKESKANANVDKKRGDISDDVAIRTDVYRPKIVDNQETGMLEYVKQRTWGDVRDQFESALKAIHVEAWEHSAYGGAEHISYQKYKQDISEDFPKGMLKVMVCDGNCEGTRIELILQDEDHNLSPVIAAKYLSDREEVWNIAMKIDQACSNGLFGY